MRELTLFEPRELTMDEMLLAAGGADADRQVPDPSHGANAASEPCFMYTYC
jgi:hypothetical protein